MLADLVSGRSSLRGFTDGRPALSLRGLSSIAARRREITVVITSTFIRTQVPSD